MERSGIIYHGNELSRLNEKFDDEKLYRSYSIYSTTRDRLPYWEVIRDIYRHLKGLSGSKYLPKELRLILYYHEPCKLIADYFGTKITLWSDDPTIQANTQNIFELWEDIKNYYESNVESSLQRLKRQREREAEIAEIARIKEERRLKRLQNDPNSPAARNRKARRHLQRLGYELHKSNKIYYFTDDDKGKFKITDSKGNAVLGVNFDATSEEVEAFYCAADIANNRDGAWYNRYRNYEERKTIVIDKLSQYKIQVQLISDWMPDLWGKKNFTLTNMRGEKYRQQKQLFHHLESKDGSQEFDLSEVELICQALESMPKQTAVYQIQDWVKQNL